MGAEARWLTEASLLAIHAQQVERFGGAHGVIDHNVVLSALAQPQQGWSFDKSADLADFAGFAAAYLVGFARAQGFRDGNKRTGLACALVLLGLNDVAIVASGEDLYQITMDVADNRADDAVVASFLRERFAEPKAD
jgi:death on curing protein